MKLWVVLCGLFSVSFTLDTASFDCNLNLREDSDTVRSLSTRNTSNHHFTFTLRLEGKAITDQKITYGEQYTVELHNTEATPMPFCKFAIQARWLHQIEGAGGIGHYPEIYRHLTAMEHECDSDGGTITNRRDNSKENVTAKFTILPQDERKYDAERSDGKKQLQFWAALTTCIIGEPQTFKVVSNLFNVQTQTEEEFVPPTERPQVNDWHDKNREDLAKNEFERKMRESIDLEQKLSEGDWQKVRMEEERQHQAEVDMERRDYEERQAEIERQRQERIRWEIMDAEEHDRIEEEEEEEKEKEEEEESSEEVHENEIDFDDDKDHKASSATQVIFSITAIVLAFAAYRL